MTLDQLERDIDSKIDPRWQESIALSDIAQYLNLKNHKLDDDVEHTKYLQDLRNIYQLIVDNLPAALMSPSVYVREWAMFINNNEVIGRESNNS